MFQMNVDIRYNMVLVGLQYYTFFGNENFSILFLQIHNANFKGPKMSLIVMKQILVVH